MGRSGSSLQEPTAEDALEVAQRALSTVLEQEDRVSDLQGDLEELRADVEALRAKVSDRFEGRDYDQLRRDEKIGLVRAHAFEQATSAPTGRAALDYRDVLEDVFDGSPSPAHAYKLMRWAAEADGFDLRDPADHNRQLIVDAETVMADQVGDRSGLRLINAGDKNAP